MISYTISYRRLFNMYQQYTIFKGNLKEPYQTLIKNKLKKIMVSYIIIHKKGNAEKLQKFIFK